MSFYLGSKIKGEAGPGLSAKAEECFFS